MKYNPISKEFQEKAKELGITGYQYHIKLINEEKLLNPTDVNRKNRTKTAINKGFNSYTEYNRHASHLSAINNGFNSYNEYHRYINHENGTYFPVQDNESCPSYLGVHISERQDAIKILPKIIGKIIEIMPYGNHGFDFLVEDNIKVDVKSRQFIDNKYSFMIRYNNIADYFLCLGYQKEKLCKAWLFKRDDMVKKQESGNRYITDKFYRREIFTISTINMENFKEHEVEL